MWPAKPFYPACEKRNRFVNDEKISQKFDDLEEYKISRNNHIT